MNVKNAFQCNEMLIIPQIEKHKNDKNGVIHYCSKCGKPFYFKSENQIIGCIYDFEGKELCCTCYNKIFGTFYHEYRTNGKKEKINDAERIKIVIYKRIHSFGFTCYIDLKSLEDSHRTTSFDNEKEIIFEKSFRNDMMDIPKFNDFKNDILIYSKRAKIPSKKALLANDRFIKYLYECIKHSMNVGIDKQYITLMNGL